MKWETKSKSSWTTVKSIEYKGEKLKSIISLHPLIQIVVVILWPVVLELDQDSDMGLLWYVGVREVVVTRTPLQWLLEGIERGWVMLWRRGTRRCNIPQPRPWIGQQISQHLIIIRYRLLIGGTCKWIWVCYNNLDLLQNFSSLLRVKDILAPWAVRIEVFVSTN